MTRAASRLSLIRLSLPYGHGFRNIPFSSRGRLMELKMARLDAVSPVLRRVVLVTGTKYYGSHLGPFKTPARESGPSPHAA